MSVKKIKKRFWWEELREKGYRGEGTGRGSIYSTLGRRQVLYQGAGLFTFRTTVDEFYNLSEEEMLAMA